MTKRKSNGQMSDEELLKRRFHSEVRNMKRICEQQGITLYNYENAPVDSICILSKDEYELGAVRRYIFVDNESYFVEESYYEQVDTL